MALDFGAFAGGFGDAMQEDPLTKLLKQRMTQPQQPQPNAAVGPLDQFQTPQPGQGFTPAPFRPPPDQFGQAQQGGGKFGTLRDLMTRLTSGLGG